MRDEGVSEMGCFQLLCIGCNKERHNYFDCYGNICCRQLWTVVEVLGVDLVGY